MKDREPALINGDPSCLDPDLGAELWRLATPDCPPRMRQRLETHVNYCAACRLQLAVERQVAAGLREGRLALRRPARVQVAAWSGGVGITAVACGLALLLLLPPRATHDGMHLRGDGDPAIERPVPDEVVRGGRPTLRWTPLAGATRYDVRVEAVDGSHRWSTSTRIAEATVPADAALPLDVRYRVRIEPVPAHLAPAVGLRTSFRTGGTGAWLNYRLRHGRAAGRWLGGCGLAGILAGVVSLLWRRGAP